MTINYDDVQSFEYQQAVFFVGLELEFIKDVEISGVTYSCGRRAYVEHLTDFGQGCVLSIRAVSPKIHKKNKRLGLFDKKAFFDSFRPAHFYV